MLAINGAELKRLGLPPGPSYGEILRRLLRLKLDGELPTPEDERQAAGRLALELGRA